MVWSLVKNWDNFTFTLPSHITFTDMELNLLSEVMTCYSYLSRSPLNICVKVSQIVLRTSW